MSVSQLKSLIEITILTKTKSTILKKIQYSNHVEEKGNILRSVPAAQKQVIYSGRSVVQRPQITN